MALKPSNLNQCPCFILYNVACQHLRKKKQLLFPCPYNNQSSLNLVSTQKIKWGFEINVLHSLRQMRSDFQRTSSVLYLILLVLNSLGFVVFQKNKNMCLNKTNSNNTEEYKMKSKSFLSCSHLWSYFTGSQKLSLCVDVCVCTHACTHTQLQL